MAKLNHIENLYKNQDILLFKRAWALEKIHGCAASINWSDNKLTFSAGSESHSKFCSLFNEAELKEKLINQGFNSRNVVIYGEAYGGCCQKMSHTYGKELKFIAFDVLHDENYWLNVPAAETFCKELGIEFVHYVEISTDLKEIDEQRDAVSVQAVRNGITPPREREGIVLRPLIEVIKSNGERVMSKHKGDKFRETASPRVVEDPNKLKVLADTNKIACEWVTMNRLEHVLQRVPDHNMSKISIIINEMVSDVLREADKEIVNNKSVEAAIKKKTVELYKNYAAPKKDKIIGAHSFSGELSKEEIIKIHNEIMDRPIIDCPSDLKL